MEEPYVIYEEKEWAAIMKPSGLQMHAAKFIAKGAPVRKTLADWALKKYPEIAAVGDNPEERPGIVHRLDRDTSGLVLIARTQEYFTYLKNLFKSRQVDKKYLVLVRGHLKEKEGTIDKPIGIISGSTRRSVRSDKMAKSAVTEYATLADLIRPEDEFESALLRISPKTGRTHQIRVHLAHINHPVLGDPLYGPKKQPEWVTRLMLHAWTLEFEVRPGKRMQLAASPDAEFMKICAAAGLQKNSKLYTG